MMGLTDLQNQFQNCLMHADTAFESCIRGTAKVPADIRLSIYKNAYQIRLIDALAANYPVLKKCFGCEQFNELGELYLKKYPSTFRSVRWFGDQLPLFLYEVQPYCNMPYLAELAQFEWLNTLVFDAPDSPVLQIDSVIAIQPENWSEMRFRPHPSLYCLSLRWNVIQIWQAINLSQPMPAPEEQAIAVSWALWRKELTNQFSSTPEDETWAINAVLQGGTFGEICEGLCQWVGEENAGLHAASLLKGWIQSGLLSDIIL